jgi:drug/metabolite transporter (DMT)-like permease
MASASNGRNLKLGLSAVVAASILFSAKSVFFKMCYAYGTPPVVLQAMRGAFSLPFFLLPLILVRFRGAAASPAPLSGRDLAVIAWLGFSGYYLASIFDMVGLQYISAGTERLILYVYPTLVVLFGAWIFRKRIPRSMYVPLALSYAGIALSFGGEAAAGEPGARPYYGGFLVFLSAVFYALFLVWQGRLIGRVGSQRLGALCMMVSTACIFIQFLAGYPLEALAQPAPVVWIAILTSVFCNVVPVYLYGYGVNLVGAGKAAVVSSVGPVSTMALAGGLLGESTGPLQIGGLLLVVAGTLKLGMDMGKSAPAPSASGPMAPKAGSDAVQESAGVSTAAAGVSGRRGLK